MKSQSGTTNVTLWNWGYLRRYKTPAKYICTSTSQSNHPKLTTLQQSQDAWQPLRHVETCLCKLPAATVTKGSRMRLIKWNLKQWKSQFLIISQFSILTCHRKKNTHQTTAAAIFCHHQPSGIIVILVVIFWFCSPPLATNPPPRLKVNFMFLGFYFGSFLVKAATELEVD